MASPVVLPRQGQSVESCIITSWSKQVGDAVQVGDVLFTYETDKATFEEQAKEAGTLLKVFFEADDDVPVLTTVAVIGQPGEDVSAFTPEGAAEPAAPAAETPAPTPAPKQDAPAASAPEQPAQGVSPRARATAERLGVNLAAAVPTGPHGRVIERDVFTARETQPQAQPEKPAESPVAAPAAPAAAAAITQEYTDVKLTNVRRVIARTMHASLQQMAQLTHHTSFDATQLNALRAKLKAAPEELGLPRITVNDLILFAVSRVLVKYPDINAHYMDDHVRQFTHVNLGVAVDTPRGLLVPTVYVADTKPLAVIAQEAKAVITSAQAGSINPDLLTGGTITITNLGTLGIESFTPIINPPQVAILGVGAMVERVRTVNGQLKAYPAIGLSLTYDHRAVDGAPASRFLKDLVTALENLTVLLTL